MCPALKKVCPSAQSIFTCWTWSLLKALPIKMDPLKALKVVLRFIPMSSLKCEVWICSAIFLPVRQLLRGPKRLHRSRIAFIIFQGIIIQFLRAKILNLNSFNSFDGASIYESNAMQNLKSITVLAYSRQGIYELISSYIRY
jgi:hypothetical protein